MAAWKWCIITVLLIGGGVGLWLKMDRVSSSDETVPVVTDSGKEELQKLIAESPKAEGFGYCCINLVRAVNGLRRLGKETALAELQRYVTKNPGETERVFLIAVCLFPDGQWSHIELGTGYPMMSPDSKSGVPTYPLMISEGVPFLVIRGYSPDSSGLPVATAQAVINECKGLSMVTKDFPETGFNQAGESLIASAQFKSAFVYSYELGPTKSMVMGQTRQ